MTKVRVHNFMMSVDGFVAGPDQSLENPLGVRGFDLHQWRFADPAERISVARSGADSIGRCRDERIG